MPPLSRLTFLCLLAAFVQARANDGLPSTLDEAKTWFNSDVKPTFTAPASPPAVVQARALAQSKARLLVGAQRMAMRLGTSLQIGGYSDDIRADEEYRLEPIGEGLSRIVFSEKFWNRFFEKTNPDTNHHQYASYLLYVLLRAGADDDYLRRFNPERCAWIVQSDAETLTPSLRILKRSIEEPPTSWLAPDGPVYKTNEAFRLSLEPSGNSAKTIQALVRYGLSAVARRAADLYALQEYEAQAGELPTRLMRERVKQRERVEAWDYGRARAAMTQAERMAFKKMMDTSFTVEPRKIVKN